MKEFYGVIDSTESVKETYTVKNKQGKDVTKTKTVYNDKSVIIKTGESTRLLGMQVLETEARRLGGKVVATGVF